jgi:hypothetical protein
MLRARTSFRARFCKSAACQASVAPLLAALGLAVAGCSTAPPSGGAPLSPTPVPQAGDSPAARQPERRDNPTDWGGPEPADGGERKPRPGSSPAPSASNGGSPRQDAGSHPAGAAQDAGAPAATNPGAPARPRPPPRHQPHRRQARWSRDRHDPRPSPTGAGHPGRWREAALSDARASRRRAGAALSSARGCAPARPARRGIFCRSSRR